MLKIAWSPLYKHPLPEGHRFPMEKYDLIPEQLIYEGTISESNLYCPETIGIDTILLTHLPEYWEKLDKGTISAKEARRTGFPFSKQLVQRAVTIPKGTIQNALYAMQYGVAINGAGGTHHAFTDHGEGFCLLNDIAIAANWLLDQGQIQKALVVDLDVHQGNGTAEIFRDQPKVFTFSMHGQANYPYRKQISDLDIGCPTGMGDKAYLDILYNKLPYLIDLVEPDVIFYLSGVDVLETDKLGKLSLSRAGCKRRDEYVISTAKKEGIPLVISLGGGYSPMLIDIVEAHCNTFRLAQEIYF
ncbi:MAG: histone deacetylase [Bacteroidota bacterium]